MAGLFEPIWKDLSVNKLGLLIVLIILGLSVIAFIGVLDQTQKTLMESSSIAQFHMFTFIIMPLMIS